MNDLTSATSLAEQFARFVMDPKWIRSSDQTIRQDAFIPHRTSLEVSVTRHDGWSEREIWLAGENVAHARQKLLLGRADVSDTAIKQQSLHVKHDPVPGNPNHACIVGWPADKPAQKSIAQQLAAASIFRKK